MINIGFVMEQTLGHITHHQNLARWVAEDAGVCPNWMPIPWQTQDRWERFPVVGGNWSLKASLRARDALRATLQRMPLDVLFLHTQTVALFAVPTMRRVPTILSLDATPLNYDTVGAEYSHNTGNNRWLERRKYVWNRQTFRAAVQIVTWCQWAKDSLVADYGIAAEKVRIIPPGIDTERWAVGKKCGADRKDGPLRLLFVGADFERKGGRTLIAAFQNGLQRDCTLDIVTKNQAIAGELAGTEGVRVWNSLAANSEPLRRLYAEADLFVFPTRGDCLPIAVMEAMAAGLPVVATSIGALPEEVEHGVNGLIVPPDDAGAVVSAVRALAADATRRCEMSRASRRIAETRFDARANYGALLALTKECAARNAPK